MKNENLRPNNLKEYIGQEDIKEQLQMSLDASKIREKSFPHSLFYGGAGLGKTTLSRIMATEFNSQIIFANAPNIQKLPDLISYIMQLEDNDFLFIDEIHRLKKELEETLYTVMEDFRIDIITNSGTDVKPISINLPKFTLIGATTAKGKLSQPLIDRFGIKISLKEYTHEELIKISERSAKILGVKIKKDASELVAKSSRGNPRRINTILDRIIDYITVDGKDTINLNIVKKVLKAIGIDHNGLEDIDREILKIINYNFKGGPVGLNNLSATSGQDKDTLENFIEPFLLKNDFIIRTNSGRKITEKGIMAIKNSGDTNN